MLSHAPLRLLAFAFAFAAVSIAAPDAAADDGDRVPPRTTSLWGDLSAGLSTDVIGVGEVGLHVRHAWMPRLSLSAGLGLFIQTQRADGDQEEATFLDNRLTLGVRRYRTDRRGGWFIGGELGGILTSYERGRDSGLSIGATAQAEAGYQGRFVSCQLQGRVPSIFEPERGAAILFGVSLDIIQSAAAAFRDLAD